MNHTTTTRFGSRVEFYLFVWFVVHRDHHNNDENVKFKIKIIIKTGKTDKCKQP